MQKRIGPKILAFDIEKEPMLVNTYDLKPKYIHHANIEREGELMSWAAMWVGEPNSKVMCLSHRSERKKWNVKKLIEPLWDLMNEADILVSHFGEGFDEPELNAAFLDHGLKPPMPSKHRDTYKMAKRKFNYPSYSLGYLAKRLKLPHQKLDNGGMDIIRKCREGDLKAWKQFEEYNKGDVLCDIDLYRKLFPFDPKLNFSVFYGDDEIEQRCECSGTVFTKDGYAYRNNGVYHRYRCKSCGAPARGKKNIMDKTKKSFLLSPGA